MLPYDFTGNTCRNKQAVTWKKNQFISKSVNLVILVDKSSLNTVSIHNFCNWVEILPIQKLWRNWNRLDRLQVKMFLKWNKDNNHKGFNLQYGLCRVSLCSCWKGNYNSWILSISQLWLSGWWVINCHICSWRRQAFFWWSGKQEIQIQPRNWHLHLPSRPQIKTFSSTSHKQS